MTDEKNKQGTCSNLGQRQKIARDFVNNFPTNFLKSITFLHPMGVCGWTFHRTGIAIFGIFLDVFEFLYFG